MFVSPAVAKPVALAFCAVQFQTKFPKFWFKPPGFVPPPAAVGSYRRVEVAAQVAVGIVAATNCTEFVAPPSKVKELAVLLTALLATLATTSVPPDFTSIPVP